MPLSFPVNFPSPDPFKPNTEDGQAQHLRQLASVLRGVMDGKINSALDVTLEVSPATTTVISDARSRSTSRIVLHPTNNHAANEMAAGLIEIFPDDITSGSFTITHLPFSLARSFRVAFFA